MALGQMIDVIDHWGKPFQVDAALRVVTKRGVGYLDGNAHTHLGRFGVWYPDERDGFATSHDEIVSMSEEAACWLAGFLAGNEPGLEEYLGIQYLDPQPDATREDVTRWHAFTERFRRTGYCPPLGLRPDVPLVLTEKERAEMRVQGELRPWAQAGERVWVPVGDTWVEADPQPDLVDGELAGTICAERGYPELMGLEMGWSICMDCAEVHPN
jgi:hypothetical protein